MAKGTLFTLIFLTIIATFLLGINIGKRLSISQPVVQTPSPTLTQTPSPALILIPTIATASGVKISKTVSRSTYTDKTCGFSFSYPGSYIRQKSVNEQSLILTDPLDPDAAIAATCADTIPKPPLAPEKIESVTIDGVSATLYHDQDANGRPRDEIIVKHPKNGKELILAGFGPFFQEALSSFRFVQ